MVKTNLKENKHVIDSYVQERNIACQIVMFSINMANGSKHVWVKTFADTIIAG